MSLFCVRPVRWLVILTVVTCLFSLPAVNSSVRADPRKQLRREEQKLEHLIAELKKKKKHHHKKHHHKHSVASVTPKKHHKHHHKKHHKKPSSSTNNKVTI